MTASVNRASCTRSMRRGGEPPSVRALCRRSARSGAVATAVAERPLTPNSGVAPSPSSTEHDRAIASARAAEPPLRPRPRSAAAGRGCQRPLHRRSSTSDADTRSRTRSEIATLATTNTRAPAPPWAASAWTCASARPAPTTRSPPTGRTPSTDGREERRRRVGLDGKAPRRAPAGHRATTRGRVDGRRRACARAPSAGAPARVRTPGAGDAHAARTRATPSAGASGDAVARLAADGAPWHARRRTCATRPREGGPRSRGSTTSGSTTDCARAAPTSKPPADADAACACRRRRRMRRGLDLSAAGAPGVLDSRRDRARYAEPKLLNFRVVGRSRRGDSSLVTVAPPSPQAAANEARAQAHRATARNSLTRWMAAQFSDGTPPPTHPRRHGSRRRDGPRVCVGKLETVVASAGAPRREATSGADRSQRPLRVETMREAIKRLEPAGSSFRT